MEPNQPLIFRAVSGPRRVELKRRHWLVGVEGGAGMAFVFGDDESNARRFVACWNYFHGLSTHMIEMAGLHGDTVTETLQRERNELLAALRLVPIIAEEAAVAWDNDRDARVGKILLALAGRRGYRADIDDIHDLLAKHAEPRPHG